MTLLRSLLSAFRDRKNLVAENLALRRQLIGKQALVLENLAFRQQLEQLIVGIKSWNSSSDGKVASLHNLTTSSIECIVKHEPLHSPDFIRVWQYGVQPDLSSWRYVAKGESSSLRGDGVPKMLTKLTK